MGAPNTPTSEAVRQQIERILASPAFANSVRSQKFLRYVVEHSLQGGDEPLKEYSIAVEAFDRDPSYDPAVDATVRVEAGRLRSRLRDYYAEAGRNDPIRIEIPRGSYRAVFTLHLRDTASAETPQPPSPATTAQTSSTRPPIFRWVGLAVAVLFLASIGILIFRRLSPHPVQAVPTQVVLAILPFTNQTGLDVNNYLTEGLTDNLIRQFSELPRIRVIARAAIEGVDRKRVVSELGATALLSGTLQRGGDGRLTLNAELSNARDGIVLRSVQYLPDEADLRPVQADIVRDVIAGLGMHLDSPESVAALCPLTSSPAAFQEFLRAETAMENGDEDSMKTAIHLLQDAVSKDPSFAKAFASLAEAQMLIAIYFEQPADYVTGARRAAESAIALDPGNVSAHAVLGLVDLVFDWDFAGSQKELSAAGSEQNAIWALGCMAHLRDRNGNSRQAEESLRQMLEFNPSSPWLITEMGCLNYYAGRYQDSIRYYRQSLVVAPQGILAVWGLGRSLGREGHYTEALEVLHRFNTTHGIEHPLLDSEIGYLQASSGDRTGALATIQRLQTMARKGFVDPYFIAEIYLGLNDRPQTYLWLDKAFVIHSPFLVSIATDPRWSASQGDPRFQALWDKMTRYGSQKATTRLNGF